MVKTEHLIMAGVVGIAGLIGFSLLSAEDKEKLVPFPIGAGGGGFDLSNFLAGFKLPDITIPEFKFPDLTGFIPDIPSLADITEPITEPIGNIFAGATESVKEIGSAIMEFPKEFGESIGAGFAGAGKGFAEGVIAITPFGWGQAIGEALPVGTWLGSLFKPQAPSPERQARARQRLREWQGKKMGTPRVSEISGVLTTLANIPKVVSGGHAPVTGWLSEQIQAPSLSPSPIIKSAVQSFYPAVIPPAGLTSRRGGLQVN